MNLNKYLKSRKEKIEKNLQRYISNSNIKPKLLSQIIKYTLFSKSKRIRPILMLAVANMLGLSDSYIMDLALAIEMIHTYSLIHDDLPAMDNADYRRGKLSLHKKFSEALAILAGDGLLTHSWTLVAKFIKNNKIPYNIASNIINEISLSAGIDGMVKGQLYDIIYANKNIDINKINSIYINKTGKLITLSVKLPGIVQNLSPKQLRHLENFGNKIGFVFQLKDDIIDYKKNNFKNTYPAILGMNKSYELGYNLIESAKMDLKFYGKSAEILMKIADLIYARKN